MPYIVFSKTKSNHKKVVGLFEKEQLAKMYCDMMLGSSASASHYVEKCDFKDESPDLIEYVMRIKSLQLK